jgi:hypothetical protein
MPVVDLMAWVANKGREVKGGPMNVRGVIAEFLLK